ETDSMRKDANDKRQYCRSDEHRRNDCTDLKSRQAEEIEICRQVNAGEAVAKPSQGARDNQSTGIATRRQKHSVSIQKVVMRRSSPHVLVARFLGGYHFQDA